MAANFGHLVISLLKSLQLHGGGLFDVVCAYLLARIVIFCHCLMNLCLSLDVCKRSARVILSYLKSKSKVVRSVASFSVLFGRHESITGNNANFRCSQFNWNFSDFFPVDR